MAQKYVDSFGTRKVLTVGGESYDIFRLDLLEKAGFKNISRLPVSLKVLLENLLRQEDNHHVNKADIEALANWDPKAKQEKEIAFMPARVLMQDLTGVPAVVDLAAMREAMKRLGGDPKKINPLAPVDLVIDHSVQVDYFGSADAFHKNSEIEFERNVERYAFLALGPEGLRQFPLDSAGHRHLPSGQSRISRAGGFPRQERRRALRLSRHRRRHRFAHDDDQRLGRRRLGRRRHRSGSGAARPADHHAHSRSHRLQTARQAAAKARRRRIWFSPSCRCCAKKA